MSSTPLTTQQVQDAAKEEVKIGDDTLVISRVQVRLYDHEPSNPYRSIDEGVDIPVRISYGGMINHESSTLQRKLSRLLIKTLAQPTSR